MHGLIRRLERLEAAYGGPGACQTCGSAPGTGMAAAGGEIPPAWVTLNGYCRACGRRVRFYAGVDLEAV